MAERIRVRPRAQADIDEQVRYLRAEAGREQALAFLDAPAHLFERLEAFPHLGPPWPTRQRRLVGLRRARHQKKAIRAIADRKTSLVSTGTGSGKTECFLYPTISRCLQLRGG